MSCIQLETAGEGQVTVSWQCPAGEDLSTWVTGYEVKWRQGKKGDWVSKCLHDIQQLEVTLEELEDGQYEVTVCCWGDPGRGPLETVPFSLRNGWVNLITIQNSI